MKCCFCAWLIAFLFRVLLHVYCMGFAILCFFVVALCVCFVFFIMLCKPCYFNIFGMVATVVSIGKLCFFPPLFLR